MTLLKGLQSLIHESKKYSKQLTNINPTKIEITLTDTSETATLSIGEKIIAMEEQDEADLRLTMESPTFIQILKGEADFGALIGRSKMSDVRPINFEFLNPKKVSEVTHSLYDLMTVFFTPGKVKVKTLSEKYAGSAHGAHPIPLVYWNGVRHAWYIIKKGEILNEAGEIDDYPQVFTVIKGVGVAMIGEESIDVSPGMAVYVPNNTVHKLTAYEDVELVWLAWNTPLI